jgi:heme/copper-type cytochrome/quinol oxidase subunit 2
MDTLIQANIFFFISSIATVIFIILISIALFYTIGILKNVREMTENIKGVVDTASTEAKEMIDQIRRSWIFNFVFSKKKSKKETKTTK